MNIHKKVMRTVWIRYRMLFFMTIISIAACMGICVLYQISLEPFAYVLCVLMFVDAILLLAKYYEEYRRQNQRQILLKNISSQWQNLPSSLSPEEEDYHEMIETLGRDMTRLETQRVDEQTELVDYFTTWVHQIKTPIAVLKILLDQEDTPEYREMKAELFRIEQYAGMALDYARLGSETNDFVLQEYQLDDLIRQTVRKYAPQFINRRIRLIYEPVDRILVTDQKWFQCILEQLLSNAVKYTPQGNVTIAMPDPDHLTISDTGIGIAAADLPRIFEKGFTGLNGRTGNKSTGLGLYICKKAADKLEIGIQVESEPGKGTTFTLDISNCNYKSF